MKTAVGGCTLGRMRLSSSCLEACQRAQFGRYRSRVVCLAKPITSSLSISSISSYSTTFAHYKFPRQASRYPSKPYRNTAPPTLQTATTKHDESIRTLTSQSSHRYPHQQQPRYPPKEYVSRSINNNPDRADDDLFGGVGGEAGRANFRGRPAERLSIGRVLRTGWFLMRRSFRLFNLLTRENIRKAARESPLEFGLVGTA